MRHDTAFTRLAGIELPIVQAPLGGGPSTVALAAAVSRAGGLGSLAAGYQTVDQLRDDIVALMQATDRPFAVNVFVPEPTAGTVGAIDEVLRRLNPLRAELGLAALEEAPPVTDAQRDVEEKVALLTELRVPVVSFTFGLLQAELMEALTSAGTVIVGTATSVREAVVLHDAGCHAVCAQGVEAGGHHGSFIDPPGLVGTMALVPQVCDAVGVPVIAAGGIGDGRGLAAALVLGAAAAQLGTSFLRCPEAGTAPAHRAALVDGDETASVLTDRVTGKTVRGIANRLMAVLETATPPPYPVMNTLTSELRRVAASQGRRDLMSLWSGQAAALGGDLPAAELVRQLAIHADASLDHWCGGGP